MAFANQQKFSLKSLDIMTVQTWSGRARFLIPGAFDSSEKHPIGSICTWH